MFTRFGQFLDGLSGGKAMPYMSLILEAAILALLLLRGTPPPATTPPAPPPQKPSDPVAAIAKLRVGSSGCTAAAILPRRADGRWDVLTASHCTGGIGSRGVVTLKDGRSFNVTVQARDTRSDLTWFVSDRNDLGDLPFLKLADSDPPAGTRIWHAGYGIDRPTSREEGVIVGGPNSDGQIEMRLSVSSGDSGGPIMRIDTNEVIGAVCCTTNRGGPGSVWAGGPTAAARLRPGKLAEPLGPEPTADDPWEPIPVPLVKPPERMPS